MNNELIEMNIKTNIIISKMRFKITDSSFSSTIHDVTAVSLAERINRRRIVPQAQVHF